MQKIAELANSKYAGEIKAQNYRFITAKYIHSITERFASKLAVSLRFHLWILNIIWIFITKI